MPTINAKRYRCLYGTHRQRSRCRHGIHHDGTAMPDLGAVFMTGSRGSHHLDPQTEGDTQ